MVKQSQHNHKCEISGEEVGEISKGGFHVKDI